MPGAQLVGPGGSGRFEDLLDDQLETLVGSEVLVAIPGAGHGCTQSFCHGEAVPGVATVAAVAAAAQFAKFEVSR